VKQFLGNKNPPTLLTIPRSLRLLPLPKDQVSAQMNPFCVGRKCERKTAEILNSCTEHDLRKCFEHWQHRMQLCVNSEGNYFEGDHS